MLSLQQRKQKSKSWQLKPERKRNVEFYTNKILKSFVLIELCILLEVI